MVRSMKDLVGYSIDAKDGKVGKVKDFLFDDHERTIRYMVADTGGWLSSHKVLISPDHLMEPDLGLVGNHFPVDLTKSEIENCPPLDADAPVSRQYEEAFMKYYANSPYWIESAALPGFIESPIASGGMALDPEHAKNAVREPIELVNHIRSFNEVKHYDIVANDGEIGHVEDFIIDCKSWGLRYLVVDLHRWLPGGKRLFDVDWLIDFDYRGCIARLDLTKNQIEAGPAFDPHEAVNEDYQRNLYDYYGKPIREDVPPFTPY